MNTPVRSVAVAAKREAMLETARHIDSLALQAEGVFDNPCGFAEALMVAQTMNDLRAALTDEMMQPVMALMNSPLGFLTDQDPKTNKDARPYSVEVVRECFIESKLRGFHPVGNEWNIIAGRFYAAKNGLRRKVTKFPGLTDFRDSYDVPRMASEKGAILKARASWKLNGHADAIEAEIPVRVNAYMGADAIIGKAERKLLKRIFDRISGFITPDGDVDDVPVAITDGTKSETPAPRFSPPPTETQAIPVNEPPAAPDPVQLIQRTLDAGRVSFDAFRDWLRMAGLHPDADSLGSLEDLPAELVKVLLADGQKTLGKCVTIKGGAQ